MREMVSSAAVAVVAAAGVSLGVALCAPAVAGERLAPSLQACRSESDDARRLSCYDREVDELAANSARTPGLGAQQVPTTRKDVSSLPRPVERVAATITAMQLSQRAGFEITLDNGQVWREVSPEGEPRIKVGDAITIRPAPLGSFWLTTSGSNWGAKVHRIR
jgi:hypothetical protein